METTIVCFRGYADCVDGAKECGVIYGTGFTKKEKLLTLLLCRKPMKWERMLNK